MHRPKDGNPDHKLHLEHWPSKYVEKGKAAGKTKQGSGFLTILRGFYNLTLSPSLPFEIRRHQQKGLILISKTRRKRDIIKAVWGMTQWVHPDVVSCCKGVIDDHDSRVIEEDKVFVLFGPIALLSHRCRSGLQLCLDDNWVGRLVSPKQKRLGLCYLTTRKGYKWNIKPGEEITIWYGEGGVDNCCCPDCIINSK